MIERLDTIAENIQQYDWKIRDYADAHFAAEVALLQTIPGIGLITSCAFVALAPIPGSSEARATPDVISGLRRDRTSPATRTLRCTSQRRGT
jgi:hypothetical protein